MKVFRLRAEPLKQKIAPFKTIDVWGYNGSCPGPTIQVTQGDRVRVILKTACRRALQYTGTGWKFRSSRTACPSSAKNPCRREERFTYEFTVHQEGTFFYHAHSAMQEMIGLIGMFIAHPASTIYAPCGS